MNGIKIKSTKNDIDMKITRKSSISGITNTIEIDVTPEQMELWENGLWIQNAMPNVSAPEREFIKTGITPEEWDEMFAFEE